MRTRNEVYPKSHWRKYYLPIPKTAILAGNIILSSTRNAELEFPREVKSADDYRETDSLLEDNRESSEQDRAGKRPATAQCAAQRKKKKPSLVKTLMGLFGVNFAMAVLCKLVHDCLMFVQPQLLR